LRQADKSQHARGELACHVIKTEGVIIERWDQRKDGRPGICRPQHIAEMDLIKGCLAQAKDQRAFLLEGDVGGPLDQMCARAISDAAERPHATRDHHHGVGGVGAAGDAGANVCVGLLMDFAAALAEDLADEVATAAQVELFGHDAKRAVGGYEVDGSDAPITFHAEQEMFEK